jgi:hypothetical protein
MGIGFALAAALVRERRSFGAALVGRPQRGETGTSAGIGLGRLHAGTRVTLLINDLQIQVIDRHTGEILRELTLDPSRDFQPRGVPPGPPKKKP